MKVDLKDKVIAAYRKSLGNATIACKNCNITRKTFYDWKKNDEKFAEEIEYIRNNELVDFLENALFQRVQEGDTTAIIFGLKTLGKERGYVERKENVVSGNVFEDLIKGLPEVE